MVLSVNSSYIKKKSERKRKEKKRKKIPQPIQISKNIGLLLLASSPEVETTGFHLLLFLCPELCGCQGLY